MEIGDGRGGEKVEELREKMVGQWVQEMEEICKRGGRGGEEMYRRKWGW